MVINVKKDFPLLNKNPKLVYLDSAATSQKPQKVIDAVTYFYENLNSNVHRGIYDLSRDATNAYEEARGKVVNFIKGGHADEIIFTGNASEAINLAAFGFFKKYLNKGDFIITSIAEHHSNFVPWLILKKQIGVKILILPINENYEFDLEKISSSGISGSKIKLVALSHASNVTGTINPISKITSFVRKNFKNAKVLVDGSQAIPHIPVDVNKLGCDFYAFSSHKMLGPSGVGVLWANKKLLEQTDPVFVGSHMINSVTKTKAIWADLPNKLEMGTGRLEAVYGLGAAIDYLNKIGMQKIENYELELTRYTLSKLLKIDNLKIYGKTSPENRLGVFSFAVGKVHPHDTGEILNRLGICVRTGHHCAEPLMKTIGVYGTTRASIYIYNTRSDIDRLVEGIMEVKRIFKT